MKKNTYDIFISYRREGGFETANLIHDRLSQAGYKVFMDCEHLRSGKFNEQLYQQIENCKDFVVVLGKDSLERCENEDDWLRLEIAYAIKHNKNIIPIMLRNFKFPDVLPEDIDSIRLFQGVEASQELFNAFIDRLKKLLISKSQLTKNKIKKISISIIGILLVLLSLALFFIHQKNQKSQEEHLQFVQISNEIVSSVGAGFINGNNYLNYIEDVQKEWMNFYKKMRMSSNQSQQVQYVKDFNFFLEHVLKQVSDTTFVFKWNLNPSYDLLLSKKGISVEDIKVTLSIFQSEAIETKALIEKVKIYANLPVSNWLEKIDEAIYLLCELQKEELIGSYYGYIELLISMPQESHKSYLKTRPLLNKYPDVSLQRTKEELQALQDENFQKCNELLQKISVIIGAENVLLTDAEQFLKQVNENNQKIDFKKDSLKHVIEEKKQWVEQKKVEVSAKEQQVIDSYKRVLVKDSFTKNEDKWDMWGKIVHLAYFGTITIQNEKNAVKETELLKQKAIANNWDVSKVEPVYTVIKSNDVFAEVQKRLDLFLEYNNNDKNAPIYISAAKSYFKLLHEQKIPYQGIIVVLTQDDVPHPILKIGDIILERKGEIVNSSEAYAGLKDKPGDNTLKILRFNTNGTYKIFTETVPKDCKVLVGTIGMVQE